MLFVNSLFKTTVLHRLNVTLSRIVRLFGKVIAVEWKGNDFGLGLLQKYRNDSFINDTIAKIGKLQSIETHPNIYQGWTIDLRYINEDIWQLSQKIAQHNLDSHR